jgi:hypothetical protein
MGRNVQKRSVIVGAAMDHMPSMVLSQGTMYRAPTIPDLEVIDEGILLIPRIGRHDLVRDMLPLLELRLIQIGIEAALLDQAAVRTLFNNLTAI